MASDDKASAEQSLAALIAPIARIMIDNGVVLNDAVEILKSAMVQAAMADDPGATASHVSLRTGVHRKDIKRMDRRDPSPQRAIAAARVLTRWQNDPTFSTEGTPRPLQRGGEDGFDALVRSAKIDAAPATVLSLLIAAGNVIEQDGVLSFVHAAVVPLDRPEKLRAAVATLAPHLATTAGNISGDTPQMDQAVRYSHLTEEAVAKLQEEGAKLAKHMLQTLNEKADEMQQAEEGSHLFVLGAFMHIKEHD
ncbi:MAG: DUF6502 family protein [Pseudomonadota bacterium]